MRYNVCFVMDQIAGHVTNYRNLRYAAQSEPDIEATWHEIFYRKPGGAIEQVRDQLLPFVPTYITGIMRGTIEMRRALKRCSYDALFTNASVGVFFSRTFRRIPTLIDFDSTPLQIDRMSTYASTADSK